MNRKCSWLLILGVLALVIFSAEVLADEVVVKDGRVFNGVVTSGIPQLVSIDVNGVTSTVKRDSIRKIEYGSGSTGTIETTKGDVFKGSLTTEMPSSIVITTDVGAVTIKSEDIVAITFNSPMGVVDEGKTPWDYFWLESVVGTLSAAGGGIIAGLGAYLFCAVMAGDDMLGSVYTCAAVSTIGYIVGSLAVPIFAVNQVGKAYDVDGNLGLSFTMEIGGGALGFLIDSAVHTPLVFTILGSGLGAATGYNIGAEIVTEPTAIKQGAIQLVSIGMQF